MKHLELRASILHNNNQIVFQTENDLSHTRDSSLIKFGGDSILYTLRATEEFFYIKDFETKDQQTLLIESDIGINLMHYDTLTITHKEYFVDSVQKILNPGANYSVGNILHPKTGLPSVRIEDNQKLDASFLVTEVAPGGFISKIKIQTNGKYVQPPEIECELAGGTGDGAKLKLIFEQAEDRKLIEREIDEIKFENGFTKILLNYPLPEGITEGKLSCQKWRGNVIGDYHGENKYGEICVVLRDYTPFLKLPLMIKNGNSPDVIFNESMKKIDAKLEEIAKKLNL